MIINILKTVADTAKVTISD